jgi:flagellar FliL protein
MAEEATAPKEAETTQAAPEESPKGGKGKLLIVVAAVVLLAGGGAGWFLLGRGHAEEKKKEEVLEPEPKLGALVALDPFVANLADEDGKRYLKAQLQVEFFGPAAPEAFEKRHAQIRDLLLTLFTSKLYAEIRTPAGKQVLRDEIINRLNRVLGKDDVKAVYFTEFIVQ